MLSKPCDFTLEDHPIDQGRPLKVGVIGAGISGISAGALLPQKVPGIQLKIFDKNSDVGGTWIENIYPGVRCDIPSNVYQSIFDPHTQWTEEYARGAEIEAYWQNVAQKHGVYEVLHPNRKVRRAEWSDSTAQWTLTIERMDTGGTFQESFDCIITAVGRFNDWRMPNYPGMDEYQGVLRHSSNWDPTFDPKGKNVAVIGNGASGLQVVPELQMVVNRLDHYARSPTWVAGSHDVKDRQFGPMYYSREQLKEFEDPDKYLAYRKQREEPQWRKFESIFKDQVANENQRQQFTRIMAERLKDKPELLQELLPDFPPNCRRLTPGPGYLESLTKDNVDFISTKIKRFTKTGIETEDGKHREVDAVICATGANIKGEMPFSIISRGIDLSEAFKPGGYWGFPYSYMGVATPGFPNLTYVYGPSSIVPSGTTSVNVENQLTYIAKILRKMSIQGIRSMAPSQAAADDFIEFVDEFYKHTVMTSNCSSWANGGMAGGRIHAYWPGSQGHFNFFRRELRGEDWEYSLTTKTHNRFAWMGNGWTKREEDRKSKDLMSYLKKPEDLDLRSLWENWWEP